MSRQYFIGNSAPGLTAAPAKVTTGTAIKTLLQVQASSTIPFVVFAWSISFDGITAATPIVCELVDTALIAATVTAHVAGGIQPYGPDQTASTVILGTAATGYTATAEGTTTVARLGDLQLVQPTNQWPAQFPLSREFYVPPSHNLRVRVTAPAAVNASTWVLIEEQ
jgi:hypothetical protein